MLSYLICLPAIVDISARKKSLVPHINLLFMWDCYRFVCLLSEVKSNSAGSSQPKFVSVECIILERSFHPRRIRFQVLSIISVSNQK